MYIRSWNNQYVTSASLAVAVYTDYLTLAGQSLNCGGAVYSPSTLFEFPKGQVKLAARSLVYAIRGLPKKNLYLGIKEFSMCASTWQV